jgi:hypothetical protein
MQLPKYLAKTAPFGHGSVNKQCRSLRSRRSRVNAGVSQTSVSGMVLALDVPLQL